MMMMMMIGLPALQMWKHVSKVSYFSLVFTGDGVKLKTP